MHSPSILVYLLQQTSGRRAQVQSLGWPVCPRSQAAVSCEWIEPQHPWAHISHEVAPPYLGGRGGVGGG